MLTIARGDRGHARTLNRAARVARGDVLVLLSGRCLPVGTDWLGDLVRHFDDPVVAGAWGPEIGPSAVVPVPDAPVRQEAGSYTRENWAYGLSSDNGAVRARLWRHELFDESFPVLEDKQWACVMMERGYCVVYDPAAVVRRDRHRIRSAHPRPRLVRQALEAMFSTVTGEPRVGAAGARVSAADPSP